MSYEKPTLLQVIRQAIKVKRTQRKDYKETHKLLMKQETIMIEDNPNREEQEIIIRQEQTIGMEILKDL